MLYKIEEKKEKEQKETKKEQKKEVHEKKQKQKEETENKNNFPLNLKVAKITSVEEVKDADKLYILQLELKGEKRQIVAGIKKYYAKEALLNKKILIIANLKPAKIKGIKSEGMLLVAEKDNNLKLLDPGAAEEGETAKIEGLENRASRVEYDDFAALNLEVKGKKVLFQGKALKIGKNPIIADMPDGSKIS